MGACLSSSKGHLDEVDDSVHVMLAHDRKKRKETGEAPSGYKPRAANPALEKKRMETAIVVEEKEEATALGVAKGNGVPNVDSNPSSGGDGGEDE